MNMPHDSAMKICYLFTIVITSGVIYFMYFTSKGKELTPAKRINQLQKRGRNVNKRINEISNQHGCGHNLLMGINIEYAELNREMDKIMNELKPLVDYRG